MSVYKDLGFKNENGKIQVPSAETFRGMSLNDLESYLNGTLDEQVDYNYHKYSEDVDGAYIVENFNNVTALINDIFEDGSCVSTFPLDGNTHNLKRIVDSKYFNTIYSNSPAATDYFSRSCAIGNDFFLVGSYFDDDKGTDAGKVEMFALDGTYIKTIYSNSPAASDHFGMSCAIGNDFILIGSHTDDDKGTDTGKVEMFTLDGTYIKTIYGNSPTTSDNFGVSVAIGDDFFLVGSHLDDDKGADVGKVEMFTLDGTYKKTIYSNNPAADDRFGASVAIGSDFFLVGSYFDDDKGTNAGKVEMFTLDGTYIKTIYSNSPAASDHFGMSCAIGNDFFLVGSVGDDDKGTDTGKVEMFNLDGTYIKTIYSSNPAASDYFGVSVAIGSDFFLVGSFYDDDKGTDAGKVEMFAIFKEDMKDKYKNVVYEKTIYSNSPAAGDKFSRSCAIGNDFFLVGSYFDDDKGTDAGKVEMFSLDGTYIKTIYSNSPATGDYFGISCAIGSDFFLVGSNADDDKGSNAGKVEMFTLDGTYIKTIYSNNPAANDSFGQSCAIGDDFFLVSSHSDDDKATDAGKVEMFALDGTYIKTIYSNSPAASDYFGMSCAIGNDFFLVGSFLDDDKGTNAGKVEMFTLDGTYIKTIYSNSPAADDNFGVSCAIGSDFFLVGSHLDDDKATDAGKVEMFSLNGTYIKTIYSSNPAVSDLFGISVAIGSDFILVGSLYDDDKGTDAGKVEMFRLGDITTPLNVSYEDGKFGQCAVFNGTSSKITTTIPLSLTQTFSFWIKTSVNGSEDIWTGAQGITGFDIPGVGGGDFSIKLNSTNKMMLFIGFVPGVDNFIQGTKTVTDNVWHHVVVTIDKANSKINLYVDGILDGTFSGTLSVLNAYNIEFGRNTFSYFNGSIDQVRIFNKALSLAEVTKLYNENETVVLTQEVGQDNWGKYQVIATNYNNVGVIKVNDTVQIEQITEKINSKVKKVVFNLNRTTDNLSYLTCKSRFRDKDGNIFKFGNLISENSTTAIFENATVVSINPGYDSRYYPSDGFKDDSYWGSTPNPNDNGGLYYLAEVGSNTITVTFNSLVDIYDIDVITTPYYIYARTDYNINFYDNDDNIIKSVYTTGYGKELNVVDTLDISSNMTTFIEQQVDVRDLVISTTGSADEIIVNLWTEE